MGNITNVDKKVRQSNNFVESPYAQEFTATELKILEIAVSDCKITDKILVEKENNKKFEFSTKDLAKLLNTSVSTLSHEAERLSKSIIKKFIHGRKELSNGEVEFETIAIIPYTKYENGVFSFELNHKLLPYFIEINGSFTEYSLKYLMNLKSAYGIKLYKLLFQYRKIGYRKFEVDELRKQFGIEIKKYKLYSDFKRRILDFSVTQINQFTDLQVEYAEIKTRNKISEIEFRFKIKNNLLENIQSDKQAISEELEELIHPIKNRISEKTKTLLINNFQASGSSYIKASIDYASQNSTKNFDKYLQDTVTNNWAILKANELDQLKEKKLKEEQLKEIREKKEKKELKIHQEAAEKQFKSLSEDESTKILAELISQITKKCPDKLQDVLKERESFMIAYWANKQNLTYKGSFQLRLNTWLKS